jgi:hypothetical protein
MRGIPAYETSDNRRLSFLGFCFLVVLRARAKSAHNDEKPVVSNLSKKASRDPWRGTVLELFALGQTVMTELRLTTAKTK